MNCLIRFMIVVIAIEMAAISVLFWGVYAP